MRWRVRPGAISGTAEVPGDKSIGHRALMIAGLARGASRIENLPSGADVAATAECMRTLGVAVARSNGVAVVEGGPFKNGTVLDAANSGTTMRLLAGILAGVGTTAELVGDASLSRRPMARIVEPLARMGARIEATDGRAPLRLGGGRVRAIFYAMPLASAQVKSGILFAGLGADGETVVEESLPTRDHTERMLDATGVAVRRSGNRVTIRGGDLPNPFEIEIPGDVSSAAFLLVAAALHGSTVRIRNVGLNPARIGVLDVLREAGCSVRVVHQGDRLGEPAGEVSVSGRPTRPIVIGPEQVPGVIDELPLLALLATQAPGKSIVEGAAELRAKESDRIRAVTQTLSAMGADITERPDGFTVRGPVRLSGANVDSHGDHRIAMMLAVAGTAATGETVVAGAESANISFPEFPDILGGLSGRIDVG